LADAIPDWMADAIDRFGGEVIACPPCTFSLPAGHTMTRAEYLASVKRASWRARRHTQANLKHGTAASVARALESREKTVALATSTTLTFTELARTLGIAKATVSRHLAAAGISRPRSSNHPKGSGGRFVAKVGLLP
jgi:DNA-binding transcriptional ArsR family regulator